MPICILLSQQLLNASKSKGATPVRLVQLSLDSHLADYKAGRKEIEAWLKDLDACIEEMRVDALNRRCRVSVAEVEAYALHLSRLSQRLASFKGTCFKSQTNCQKMVRFNKLGISDFLSSHLPCDSASTESLQIVH